MHSVYIIGLVASITSVLASTASAVLIWRRWRKSQVELNSALLLAHRKISRLESELVDYATRICSEVPGNTAQAHRFCERSKARVIDVLRQIIYTKRSAQPDGLITISGREIMRAAVAVGDNGSEASWDNLFNRMLHKKLGIANRSDAHKKCHFSKKRFSFRPDDPRIKQALGAEL